MDKVEYNTLVEGLQALNDPRQARGIRYPWLLLLTLIALALVSGEKTPHAIAHGVKLPWAELCRELQPPKETCPSEATIRRVLRGIDITHLESLLTKANRPHPSALTEKTGWWGQAVEGKELRGVRAHGQSLHLVSLVQHASGVVLAQTQVDQKSNEITAAPKLLAGRDLTGTVTTVEALLTQRHFARHIRAQKGHYLMVVKANQPEL